MPFGRIKRFIVPQNDVFFDLMRRQAETAHTASQALNDLLVDYRDIRAKAKKIKELEHEGDQLMRDLYTALNKTFIVPIDHSDISLLAGSLDDVLDLADEASTLLVIYDIGAPSPAMTRIGELLVKQTSQLKNAVATLNHSGTYSKAAAHCAEIKNLENKADEVYNRGLSELFGKTDPIEIMKQKEILDCLESATDKADKAAQVISDVIMKHA